jgi:hypothetical protein
VAQIYIFDVAQIYIFKKYKISPSTLYAQNLGAGAYDALGRISSLG